MKSAKIVNRILLISLACGSATLVAGMLAGNENFKKALVGVGGTASMAGIAGALVLNSKQDEENQENSLSADQISELQSQKASTQKSFEEATVKMQAVEADINSLQTEHNQLLGIISDLNSQKQQLELEHNSKKQEIEAVNTNISELENHKQSLESENNNLKLEIEKLSLKYEELEQVIAPIEESFVNVDIKDESKSFSEVTPAPELEVNRLVDSIDKSELEALNNELVASQQNDAAINSIEEDVNPFASSEESSEFVDEESDSELEMVDKLIGAFDESELDMFEQKSSVSDEYSVDEEFDSELEEEIEPFASSEQAADSESSWEPEQA
ncbi:MAG: hypothetical protein AAF298_25670, partial [Cyanobacteria bacterium P01_A01_bin.40]